MNFLLAHILDWHNARLARRPDLHPRGSMPFAAVRRVGLLAHLSGQDPTAFRRVSALADRFEKAHKQVEVLVYYDQTPADQSLFRFPFFTARDLNWRGEVTCQEVNAFVAHEFDYLYDLSLDVFAPFTQLLLRSRARCRVGRHEPGREKILELMVQLPPAGTDQQLHDRMYDLTSAITAPSA